jgi:hypothetical protein
MKSSMRSPSELSPALVALLALVLPVATSSGQGRVQAQPGMSFQDVYWDTLDANGRLTGGKTQMFVPDRRALKGVLPADAVELTQSLVLPPDPANRVHMVFVGDGFTAAQLGTYASEVATISASFFNKDPYLTYQPYFSIYRVDVVSNESGVDNDPTQGILKDTALDMEYWCNGIDRLLCVDVTKAYQFASNAPYVHLVAALANSSTYGGAGYPSNNLATCAAANGSALEIMRHEFGHALGNLADEYDYGGPTTYTGGEPSDVNVSILTSAQMAAASTKWFRWLGYSDAAFDGLVSTYQGAMYSQLGIYRPTNNSLMRSLGRPFNLPSAESIVIQIYHFVHPIDDSSSTVTLYDGTETLYVTPLAPAGAGHALTVQWSLSGTPIPGATGTALDLSSLALGTCPVDVTVTVKDPTTLVRDEAARAQWMTQTLTFHVQPGGPPISSYCVAAPNSAGPGAHLYASGTSSVTANDLMLNAYGCPPNKTGLFFYGTATAQIPLGNGFRCVGGSIFRLPSLTTNIFGDASFNLDLTHLPNGGGINPGDTRYFQLWYRDPAAGGAFFNESDGLSVHFCP